MTDRRTADLLHAVVRSEAHGSFFVCADEQNPRTFGRAISPVRVFHDGELRIEHAGEVRQAVLCDGCLEGLIRDLLPAGGLVIR